MRRAFMILLVLAMAPFAANAEVAVRSLRPGAAPPPAKVTDLAWLEGSWVGAGLGGQAEEAYSAPSAGTIVGFFRFVKNGKPVFYELVTVVEDGAGSVLLRLKHFNADLTGWEEKNKSVEFKLVAIEDQTAYFDGLTIKRDGDNLFAAVLIKQKDGAERVEQFSYTLKR